jgi:hypothetical protein
MDGFEAVLDLVRRAEHPDYGSIGYDGQKRVITTTVQFDLVTGRQEDPELIRQRAVRYLEGLTPEERQLLDVEVVFRAGAPVRAVLKGSTEDLPPARLVELSRKLTQL